MLKLLILFQVAFATLSGYQNFWGFFLNCLLFHQFCYQEDIFLISSKLEPRERKYLNITNLSYICLI